MYILLLGLRVSMKKIITLLAVLAAMAIPTQAMAYAPTGLSLADATVLGKHAWSQVYSNGTFNNDIGLSWVNNGFGSTFGIFIYAGAGFKGGLISGITLAQSVSYDYRVRLEAKSCSTCTYHFVSDSGNVQSGISHYTHNSFQNGDFTGISIAGNATDNYMHCGGAEYAYRVWVKAGIDPTGGFDNNVVWGPAWYTGYMYPPTSSSPNISTC
jgi:hypothetical protein